MKSWKLKAQKVKKFSKKTKKKSLIEEEVNEADNSVRESHH